jgi:trk system potassium uptake protein TrkA
MRKQALIIGLGQFGMSLARSLTERGVEVMAVDVKESLVQAAATFTAEAVCFDAMDADALAQAAPDRRDVCVCAIGDEAREAAIIATAMLRQLGAPHVVSRANDDVTERILRLVGAHEVVNPEKAFGERLASRLIYGSIVGELPLGDDLVITELRPPDSFVGRTLIELELPRRYGVTVVAVRRDEGGERRIILPDPRETLSAGDIVVVVAAPGAVNEMMERLA